MPLTIKNHTHIGWQCNLSKIEKSSFDHILNNIKISTLKYEAHFALEIGQHKRASKEIKLIEGSIAKQSKKKLETEGKMERMENNQLTPPPPDSNGIAQTMPIFFRHFSCYTSDMALTFQTLYTKYCGIPISRFC